MAASTSARNRAFHGEPALELKAGATSAVFLPGLGMTGVSLRSRGREYLAVPGGVGALRAGRTAGLPLLAPWANRLAGRHYRVGRVAVDLTRLRLTVDDNGLPIHGLLVGRPGWHVDRVWTHGDSARLHASIEVDAPAFPFPHRLEVRVVLREAQLRVETTIIPTARRSVPVAFGWHPYLRLPARPRSAWLLRLPTRRHLALDDRGIPTGRVTREPAERAAIGRRTFDDLYSLGRDHRLAFEDGRGGGVELSCGPGYPFAQVWVPRGRTFAALEPMSAPTNALVDGKAPLVGRGDTLSATFALTLTD